MTEKRLIDANAIKYTLKAEPGGWGGEPYEIAAKHDIDKMPIVDAVEVVRCKNCDWYREHEGGICVNPKCGKSWYGCPVPAEHFCSYGEGREGE